MKVIERKTENHQELLTVEMEQAEVDAALNKAYEELVNEVNIDGFRKGKAPREVLERYVGKDELFDHAMKGSLPKVLGDIIAENKIQVYATPSLRVTKKDPVVFEAVVPLPPDVKLGDYNSIKMKPPEVKIEDKAVDEMLERARHQCADWEVTGQPAELKDMAVVDVESSIDGAEFINEKGASFQILAGWRFPAPGFSEELLGLKTGDEKEFKLKLPDDYADKEKASKEVNFKIKMVDIRREKLPELDDAFAKQVSPTVEGMAALRDMIKTDLFRRTETETRTSFEEKVLDALVEKSEVEFPPVLVEMELDRMVQQYVDRLRDSTQNEEEFNAIMRMTSEEKLRETYRPQAVQHVKRNLVIAKVIEAEKVEATGAEIDLQIATLTANAGDKLKEQTTYLNQPENRDSLRWWLNTQKAKKLLVDKAQAD